jgi:hypothetical protein
MVFIGKFQSRGTSQNGQIIGRMPLIQPLKKGNRFGRFPTVFGKPEMPAHVGWGTIIYYAQAKNALLTDRWIWWILPPGVCIILVSCALMMITYGLEKQTDGRLESEG